MGIFANVFCVSSILAVVVSGYALFRIFRAMTPDGKAPGRWIATIGLALGVAETFLYFSPFLFPVSTGG